MATPSSTFISPVRIVWPDGRSDTARLHSIGKSGGAGEVFNIEGRPDHVAKIYHATIAPAQRALYARKIRWMIHNKPELPPIPAPYRNVVQLAWPVATVLQGSGFAGFVMEKVDFARTMELDYLLTRRQAAAEGFSVDYGKLVTICCNLAALLNSLHGKRIAVVDLKPINLKVYKSELYVCILDCDGFHIQAEDFVSDAPQVTPEYLAPEFHERTVANPPAQDSFALATIIFRLFNYGIHPYAGIATGRQAYPAELAARIKLGLYPYGRTASTQVRPTPASVHVCFPDAIRALFDRAFAPAGTGRAGPREWAQALSPYANRNAAGLAHCAAGHLQFAGSDCPTCLREGILRGHVKRQRRITTRIHATPARAATYVRKTLQRTHTSPFQAALAQAQLSPPQLTPVTLPIRNIIAIEILWSIGLLITYWWVR